jgi:hypothetical protein
LLGRQVFLAGMPSGVTPSQGQGLRRLTFGQTTFRPTVNNGRILWYSLSGSTASTVSIMLADLQNEAQPIIREIVADADVLFTGPPALDEHGNVAYVKKVSGRHQLFLYDGTTQTHVQLSDNPTIPGSPTIGLGTDRRSTGWPRVANRCSDKV